VSVTGGTKGGWTEAVTRPVVIAGYQVTIVTRFEELDHVELRGAHHQIIRNHGEADVNVKACPMDLYTAILVAKYEVTPNIL
jgi:hypothetical protein